MYLCLVSGVIVSGYFIKKITDVLHIIRNMVVRPKCSRDRFWRVFDKFVLSMRQCGCQKLVKSSGAVDRAKLVNNLSC